VACDFGYHAVLFDVKANFAKSGTPIQSQNSHGSSLIVVLEKSSAGQQHADTAHPLRLLRPRRERPRDGAAECGSVFPRAAAVISRSSSRNRLSEAVICAFLRDSTGWAGRNGGPMASA